MRKLFTTLALALMVVCALVVTACGGTTPSAIQHDQGAINNDLQRLEAAEPLPVLLDSADRRIQNYYYTAEADPNKIWYLETESMTGQVKGTYTIRGPVENISDQVTNPQQQTCHGGSNGDANCDTIGLAEPNGIYPGVSNDHVAILVNGAILRWEGQYETSDAPFTVKTPTLLTINANAPISETNLSKTRGGKLPPRR